MVRAPDSLQQVEAEVVSCTRCPRLVAYRRQVARARKKQFSDWDYWGRPVPGFGDLKASLLIVGLAPAPHGGNRTGRVFTGDKSAEFLIQSLHKAGFANQPISKSRDDGLSLQGAFMTAAVKCAPPENQPTRGEAENCSVFLGREISLLTDSRAILCLGKFAYDWVLSVLKAEHGIQAKTPAFQHGLKLELRPGLPCLFASYHPSPRNTQTGKLSRRMFQSLLSRIRKEIDAATRLASQNSY